MTTWTLISFDFPRLSKSQRKAAEQFRKQIIKMGFTSLQYSVYAKYHHTSLAPAITPLIPPEGQVIIIHFTPKQFEAIQCVRNGKTEPLKNPPPKLWLL